jgi:hypothetical protein
MFPFALFALMARLISFGEPASPEIVQLSPGLVVNRVQKLVFVDAEVVQREVQLELLLSPKGLREHETILVADVKPQDVHVALLLAGAYPGRPVQSNPFVPPTGQRIKFWIELEDKQGRRIIDGREWIRSERTKKALSADFVFAGSAFVRPPGSERTVYLANEGYVVCVSNFPHSIIDIGIKSSKEAADLEFVAWKDRVPEKGTKVRVILEPIID